MPEKYPNDFPVVLRNFLEIVRDEAKEITDMESFEVAFQALDDYDNNNKFIKWLLRYINRSAAIYFSICSNIKSSFSSISASFCIIITRQSFSSFAFTRSPHI